MHLVEFPVNKQKSFVQMHCPWARTMLPDISPDNWLFSCPRTFGNWQSLGYILTIGYAATAVKNLLLLRRHSRMQPWNENNISEIYCKCTKILRKRALDFSQKCDSYLFWGRFVAQSDLQLLLSDRPASLAKKDSCWESCFIGLGTQTHTSKDLRLRCKKKSKGQLETGAVWYRSNIPPRSTNFS